MTKIIIFEGCDGAGKTTLAQKCAKDLDARYVHFGPHTGVKKTVARMYTEAALPALLGYGDVVFDRSWLSEVPYGVAFRGGADRLGHAQRRMLERIFMRCETTVIKCDPGWGEVRKNFIKDQAEEMLDTPEQLRVVYDQYAEQKTSLPVMQWNYLQHPQPDWLQLVSTTPHWVGSETAGNVEAKILIVGDNYANLTDADSFYQKPFCAFSGAGCSGWLTDQLELAGVGEERLFWVNADHLEDVSKHDWRGSLVIALGTVAAMTCKNHGFANLIEIEHPQSWKRFKATQSYPLLEVFK